MLKLQPGGMPWKQPGGSPGIPAKGAKMREDVKARKALPYDGKPTWHGLYLDGGMWRIVRNDNHLPIAYASESAAIDGAIYMLGKQP
jgi:hypothetical protein